jgi:transcription elongation factor GreA
VLQSSGEHNRCARIFFRMKARILKKFEDEIADLERELHRDLPREIQRARELGDLRENAEYQAAKDRQGIVNARIAMLKKRIAEISIMNLDKIPRDRAAFGSTVHLREDTGDSMVYQLVMPEEADAAKGLISTSSPIGRAIVGKVEGDEIKVTTPRGTRNFEILKLATIHDEA